MASVVSLQLWDAGSLPGPAQRVKDPVLLQLWPTQEFHMLQGGQKRKKKFFDLNIVKSVLFLLNVYDI